MGRATRAIRMLPPVGPKAHASIPAAPGLVLKYEANAFYNPDRSGGNAWNH